MLVSAVIEPAAIQGPALSVVRAATGAERLLDASMHNLILVAPTEHGVTRDLVASASALQGKSGQRVQLYAAELHKNRKRCIATPASEVPTNGDNANHLMNLQSALRADKIVCSDVTKAEIRRVGAPCEVCTLAEYPYSSAEERRRLWVESQRLDCLPPVLCCEIMGRTVMYAHEITVVDKMIARAAKDGSTQSVRKFARGVVYLARRWEEWSPYAGNGDANISIISAGGQTGAGQGYVDPVVAEDAICRAVQEENGTQRRIVVRVEVKQDGNPAILRDRFIGAKRRVWGVRHGMDDLGRLDGPASSRRLTFIDPDCQGHRDVLSAIRSLPAAR